MMSLPVPRAGNGNRQQNSIRQSTLASANFFGGALLAHQKGKCAREKKMEMTAEQRENTTRILEKEIKTRYDELREQVTEYHRNHPEVWELFVRFSFEMINRGFQHYSVSGIFERIRWEMDCGGDGISEFKIGNNYKPFYARRFMKIYPEHDGFFRLRYQTTMDKPALNLREFSPLDV